MNSRSLRPDPTLHAFRGELRTAPRLHPLEKTLVGIVGLHLCFLPWALGTMSVWSQAVSLALAFAGFVVVLIPRHYREEHSHEGHFTLITWPKLLRFPLFWLGLALLTYILIQALNPAYTYVQEGKFWSLQPLNPISWLPAGVEAPYRDMNAWRVLVIYTSAWLLVCSLWVGLTRRAATQYVLTAVVANGALFALIGILQKVAGNGKILWTIQHPLSTFFGTIIYRNHAAAYLNLVLGIATALLYWHFARAERRLARTNPTPMFAFAAALLGIAVLLTQSRAGILLLIGFLLVAFIAFIVRCTFNRGEGQSPWVMGLLAALFLVFLAAGASFLKVDESLGQVQKLVSDQAKDSSVSSRQLAARATWDMAQDNPITGWGAGSFRHVFPRYQCYYPDLYWVPRTTLSVFRWEYAHNDYVQLLSELGLIGAGLLIFMMGAGLRHFIHHRVWQRPHHLFLLLPLTLTLAHSWVDFQAHNPAVLLLWCATATLAARWLELEQRRSEPAKA